MNEKMLEDGGEFFRISTFCLDYMPNIPNNICIITKDVCRGWTPSPFEL